MSTRNTHPARGEASAENRRRCRLAMLAVIIFGVLLLVNISERERWK
jgi:hypothetical protein